jgi:rfaE bifunctional protein nucleotidyltransferase chain/domain
MSTFDKIHVEPKSLIPILEDYRARGQTIVFGNGCFDLIHVGHVRYLEAARELGDVLVIAVNTEASVRANVGREAPINPCEKRMEVIAAIEAVDYVIPLEAETPIFLLEMYRPDVQAKGTDYTLEQMPERETVERLGSRIEFVGDEKQHSSTELRRILRERGAL